MNAINCIILTEDITTEELLAAAEHVKKQRRIERRNQRMVELTQQIDELMTEVYQLGGWVKVTGEGQYLPYGHRIKPAELHEKGDRRLIIAYSQKV
jgi:hypothetical protein